MKEHQTIIDRLNEKVEEVEMQRDNYKKKIAEQLDDLRTEKLKSDISRQRSTANLIPGKQERLIECVIKNLFSVKIQADGRHAL